MSNRIQNLSNLLIDFDSSGEFLNTFKSKVKLKTHLLFDFLLQTGKRLPYLSVFEVQLVSYFGTVAFKFESFLWSLHGRFYGLK